MKALILSGSGTLSVTDGFSGVGPPPWRRGFESALAKKPNEVVPYKLLPDVVESVKQVVYSRLRLFNTPVLQSV